jgi:hypothetical protein
MIGLDLDLRRLKRLVIVHEYANLSGRCTRKRMAKVWSEQS